MATTPSTSQPSTGRANVYYPTRDGRPLGETPLHHRVIVRLMDVLGQWFVDSPDVYVWGNMMMYYEEGNPRKQLSPDVFVVLGVAKDTPREIYCTWLEGGHAPDLVIEITSKSTRKEDQVKKFGLYQDVLRVREYFLFDPRGEYLKPRLKGYRLEDGQYVPIEEVDGRLPSYVLGLSFEPDGQMLQLYNPRAGEWLPTEAEAERKARLTLERETEQLRQRLVELERRAANGGNGKS